MTAMTCGTTLHAQTTEYAAVTHACMQAAKIHALQTLHDTKPQSTAMGTPKTHIQRLKCMQRLGRAPHGAHWEDLAVQRWVGAVTAAAFALSPAVCCSLSLLNINCAASVDGDPYIAAKARTQFARLAENEDHDAEPAALVARHKAYSSLDQQATAWPVHK